MGRRKAVLSLSGGLDSTMLLVYLLAQNYEVRAYSFDYGQKHRIELDKVQNNIRMLQMLIGHLSHQIIDLKDCFSESASSLYSGSGVEIPTGHYADENMKSTVVENRNVIFASIIYGKALAWANKTNDSVEIFLGIHAGDHQIYPDCTEKSREACEYAFKISNWGSEKVSYSAPFVNLTKGLVLAAGINATRELHFERGDTIYLLSNTHTCYNPDTQGRSCGQCGSCVERLEAFAENGLIDPIIYNEETTIKVKEK